VPYQLEGRILEVCDCNVLCPCWIGEDADNGTCEAVVAYHFDKGNVNGMDVSGLSIAMVAHLPGNILAGNWKVAAFVDDKSTPQQQQALLDVFTCQLGGPVADLAKLVGEIVAVERVPIGFLVEGGRGTLTVGNVVDAEVVPYIGATGQPTTLNESIFSTIPGSPAYVSKASHYRRTTAKYGLNNVDLQGKNAIQGAFRFVA
jgi:hypothetical protein